MSLIGKKPIDIPSGVTVKVDEYKVSVTGPKGSLEQDYKPKLIAVELCEDGKKVLVTRKDDERFTRAMHGTTRALINNMIEGVTKGFSRDLDINGVGWGAKLAGRTLELKLGYADTRKVEIPDGVNVEVKGQRIYVNGIDKHAVGQFAAKARAHRKPEPYNAKGIKYVDEVILRKEGKAFAR